MNDTISDQVRMKVSPMEPLGVIIMKVMIALLTVIAVI